MTSQINNENQPQNNIPPTEDLMREHGVLKRILLIYGKIMERLNHCNQSCLCTIIIDTATVAKHFIEDYHQRLEEKYVFPEFLREQKYVKLVHTLQEQHNAARELTDLIIQHAKLYDPIILFDLLSLYIKMYEPHSAREDTVIFPAFRHLVSQSRFKQLGEKFEEIEEQKFGEHGFQNIVNHIAQIEQTLGIFKLSQFTPNLPSFVSCDI